MTDIDFIIDGVYYQAKSGWTGETVGKARIWIRKAMADGAQDIKYVAPGGAGGTPSEIRQFLEDPDSNPFGAVIDILDVPIP